MAGAKGRTSSKTGKRRRTSAQPLAEYQRKRDFDRTREPAGGKGGKKPRSRRDLQFVVQKHAASSLHYDLRLELDGVMRSWAVPKGPSLDPSAKRLAMQVEDHPVEYNTFEGTIPKGEYGGGTVMLWDRGTYSPGEPKKGEDAASAVRRGLDAGKLSFTLHGERLHGSFALVRTDTGDKPKWLLIKHRDDDAADSRDITREVRTSVVTGRTMEEIAAENDRVWRSDRGGAAGGEEAGTAQPRPRTAMIAPMRPQPARSLPRTGEWTYELWRGGQRVLAYATSETAMLMDERGGDVTGRYREIADELLSLAGRVKRPFVLDGEIAEDDGQGRGKGDGKGGGKGDGKGGRRGGRTTATDEVRDSLERGDGAVFYASDILLEGDDILLEEPWTERRAALESLLRRRRLKRLALQQIGKDAGSMLRRAERGGWPGILARAADEPYQPGQPTDALRRIAVR